MKKTVMILIVLLAMVVGACAPAATPTEAPAAPPTTAPTTAPVEAPTVESGASPDGEAIKVGFYGPLTGPTSQAGRALMQGAELKIEQLNAAGGLLGRPVEYITCDDKSQPEEAVKCVQKLINQDSIVVSIGSLHSPHMMATGPILDEFKVPTIGAGTSPTWCEQGFEYVWRALPNAAKATSALAIALRDSGASSIAILYQNDDYGISGRDALKGSLDFMEVVAEEAYNLGDKDWSGQIIKMIASNPDVVAAWGLGDDLGPIFNQLRDLGWEGPIVAAEGATLPEVVDVAGENVNGVILGAVYYVPETPENMADPLIRTFLTDYLARYGEMPASDNAYRGYDAASMLALAIENAGSLDAEAIKEQVDAISGVPGLAGSFDYATGGCEGLELSRVWEYENQQIIPFNGLNMAAAPAAPSGEAIKVGFYGPLTGPTSQAGRALMQGAELKIEQLNAAGGLLGRPVEYITCDDKSQPEEAVKCVQKLINQDSIVVSIGSLHSPHMMATGPILDEFKVPTIGAGTSPTWCEQGFEYVWRALPNAAKATSALAIALRDSGASSIAILYQNDDYGISGRDALKGSLDFMEVVAEEAYNLGDKDWSGQIIKMIASNPDVVAAWGLGDDLGPIFNQLRDLGWEGPIVAAEGATLPEVVDVAGENVNGVILGAVYYVPETPENMADPLIRTFLTDYLARYGEMPASDNAYRGYDAASMLALAIENAGSLDAEAIKEQVDAISGVPGLAGSFDYATGGCEGLELSRVWEYENQQIIPFNGLGQ